MPLTVADLVRAGRLETVPVDRSTAVARLLAHGLRVPARAGAHETVGLYAIERLPDSTGAVAEFQRIRRRRNKSEYDDIVMGEQDVQVDLQYARDIVAAVSSSL